MARLSYVQIDVETTPELNAKLDEWFAQVVCYTLAMPQARRESGNLALDSIALTASGHKIIESAKELAAPDPNAMCECGDTARMHNSTSRGVMGCLMAGCSCRRFVLKVVVDV
jgi:hypothetical protein